MNLLKHLFIVNPHSFWNVWKMKDVLAEINDYFKLTGIEDYKIHISKFPREAIGYIRSFVKDNHCETTVRVYAVGGDGILYDCLNGIMGLPNMELAVIPYGRSNNFIRTFGKNSKLLFRDFSSQMTARAVPLDVMQVGSNYALNCCTLGIQSLATINTLYIYHKLEESGNFGRWLVRILYEYLYPIGSALVPFKTRLLHQHYTIRVDGEELDGRYRGINIANSPFYRGNKTPTRSASVNDGFLDVLFSRAAGPLRTIRYIPVYMRGRYDLVPSDFFLRKGRKISIRSEEPLLIVMDDHMFFDMDITVEVLPGAVKFVDVTKWDMGRYSDER